MSTVWQDKASVALSSTEGANLFECSGTNLQAVEINDQQMTIGVWYKSSYVSNAEFFEDAR